MESERESSERQQDDEKDDDLLLDDTETTAVNDPNVAIILHPNRAKSRLHPRMHRIVDEQEEAKSRRLYPTSSSASSSSSSSSSMTLFDFENPTSDIPDRVSKDTLDRILGELDRFVTGLVNQSTIADLKREWMSVRKHLYQLPDTAPDIVDPNWFDVNVEYQNLMFTTNRLRLKFLEMDLMEQNTNQSSPSYAYTCRFARLFHILYNVRTQLVCYAQNEEFADPTKQYELEQQVDCINPGYFSFLLSGFEKPNAAQRMLELVFFAAFQRKFRKLWSEFPGYGETICMFEQIYTPEGHATHAWRKTTCLDKFVTTLTNRETNRRQFHDYSRTNGTLNYLKLQLKDRDDPEFPMLKRQRHIFAFRNGIYDAEQMRFFLYSRPLPSSVVAAKYFTHEFPLEILEQKYVDDPNLIPTPPLNKILDYQNIPKDTQFFVKALIGRLFHELNKYERWKVALFILGLPGTGKSITGNFILDLYEEENKGIISSDQERQFGVSAYATAFLAICTEVSETFNLSHTQLQSMIDGEYVSYARKYLTATKVPWSTLVFLMGNVVPKNWIEYGGNILRRIVCLFFQRPVEKAEPNLEKEFQDYLPHIIHACNLSYRLLAKQWNKVTFWNDDTPLYFVETREQLCLMISPIQSYIQMSGHIEVTGVITDIVSFEDFVFSLNQFCLARGYPTRRWTMLLCDPTFRRFGITQTNNELHNVKFTEKWAMSSFGSRGGGSRPGPSMSSMARTELGE